MGRVTRPRRPLLWVAPPTPLFFRNLTAALFAIIATVPDAAPRAAAAALRRVKGRPRTVPARERGAPSNPAPVGLDPAPRAAPVPAPWPAPSPTPCVSAPVMDALPQLQFRANPRPLRRRP